MRVTEKERDRGRGGDGDRYGSQVENSDSDI